MGKLKDFLGKLEENSVQTGNKTWKVCSVRDAEVLRSFGDNWE